MGAGAGAGAGAGVVTGTGIGAGSVTFPQVSANRSRGHADDVLRASVDCLSACGRMVNIVSLYLEDLLISVNSLSHSLLLSHHILWCHLSHLTPSHLILLCPIISLHILI